MPRPQVPPELIASACFILAAILIIPGMLLFMPEGKFPPGTTPHFWARNFWWVCIAVSLFLLVRVKTYRDTLLGTVLMTLFGPVTLLTLLFRRSVIRIWGR